jgi:protocatechuate 3,4-dioxygenase beta subunit
MTRVRSILQLPWLVITTAIVAASCGGGSGVRTVTPAPAPATDAPAATPGQPVQGPPQGQAVEVAQRPVEAPTGEMAGLVTDAVSQRPLARARVILTASHDVLAFNRVLITDEDGRFHFTALPAGDSFVLTASKAGYAVRSAGEMPPLYQPVPMRLATGEIRAKVDVALTPAVLIAGRLRDADGTPLANGLVEASRAVFEGGRRTLVPVADAITNDRGEFRVVGLAPGQYYLSARDPVFVGVADATGPLTYPETFFPGVLSPDDATRLTLEAGTPPATVDFTVQAGTPLRGTPVEGAETPAPGTSSIMGRITALGTGGPVARARVRLSTPGGPLTAPRATLTDADGRYRFDDLPASEGYVVTASKSGYAARGFGEGPPAKPPTPIALADHVRMETVDIVLVDEVLITGRVHDEDETPFAGALVEAMRPVFSGGRRTMVTVAEAVTDEQGEFRLTGLPPGQYYLSAFDPAYADVGDAQGQLFYSPTFYPGGVFPDEAVRITLDAFNPAEALTFRLHIITPTRVTGILTTRPGPSGVPRPLMAAAVTMSPQRNDQFSLFTLTEPSMQPNGSFVFSNVPPGRYRVQASGETEREGVHLFQTFTLEVRGAQQSIGRLFLFRGAVVSGHIEWETSAGRVPPSREHIFVRAPMADGNPFGDSMSGNVGTDDTWQIHGVMNGDHFLRVEGLPEGWQVKRVDYEGRDLTDIPYTFEYDESKSGFRIVVTDRVSRVFGWVTPRGRDDLQSYAVVVFPVNAVHWRPASRYTRITYPDARGYYEISGLPPGQYLVAATRDVDESDLGDPAVFDTLSRMPNVLSFRLDEGRGWRVDLSPVIRPRREP